MAHPPTKDRTIATSPATKNGMSLRKRGGIRSDKLSLTPLLHKQQCWVFEERLDALDELGGVVAVDHAVVEA